MNLVVFGATGNLGNELVKQALEQGHTVTGFSRKPEKLELEHPRLRRIQGDVLNPASVEKAVQGQDMVLCALGAGAKGGVRAEGTKNILAAMRKAGVRRFIGQTTLGVGDSQKTLNVYWKIMFGSVLRQAYKDHVLQEAYIKQSQLDWVIIRPAAFTDGKRTGTYQHGFEPSCKGLKLKISRADVADFMLEQLKSNTYLHQTPGLSY